MTNKLSFPTFVSVLCEKGVIFGGYVRDYLLGVEPADIDVLVPDILYAAKQLSKEFTVEMLSDSSDRISYCNYGDRHLKVRLSKPKHWTLGKDEPLSVNVDLIRGAVHLDYTVNGLTLRDHFGGPSVGLLKPHEVTCKGGDGIYPSWKDVKLLDVMGDLAAKRLVPLRGEYSSGPSMENRKWKMLMKGFVVAPAPWHKAVTPNVMANLPNSEDGEILF